MARPKFFFSGSFGNVTFYERLGTPVMRSKPVKVKQTKATKAAAQDFARAVRWSKHIRDHLSPLYKDNKLMYRMNSALLKWIRESGDDKRLKARNIQKLLSLQLNEEVIPARRIKIEPAVDMATAGKIFVTIPALKPASDIKAPAGTSKVQLTLVAIRCNADERMNNRSQPVEQHITTLEMEYNNSLVAAQQVEIPFTSIPGDIVLVAMGLTYWKRTQGKLEKVVDKKWMPAAIAGVGYRK